MLGIAGISLAGYSLYSLIKGPKTEPFFNSPTTNINVEVIQASANLVAGFVKHITNTSFNLFSLGVGSLVTYIGCSQVKNKEIARYRNLQEKIVIVVE